jgi:hypothetical protein
MNGLDRINLQEIAGIRPIIEDVDSLHIFLGFENVRVITPKVEVKLRSGSWGQIPLQIECKLRKTEHRINISFLEGYPDICPEIFVLDKHHMSPLYNSTTFRFDSIIDYNESFTDELRLRSREQIGKRQLVLELIKIAENLVPCENAEELGNVELLMPDFNSQGDGMEGVGDRVDFKCRMCREVLFSSGAVWKHEQMHQGAVCQNLFLADAPPWLSLENEGKILCKNDLCRSKIGSWSWSGFLCSCGRWIAPSFQFSKGKIDPCPLIDLQR